jgi:hypothetical protein
VALHAQVEDCNGMFGVDTWTRDRHDAASARIAGIEVIPAIWLFIRGCSKNPSISLEEFFPVSSRPRRSTGFRRRCSAWHR